MARPDAGRRRGRRDALPERGLPSYLVVFATWLAGRRIQAPAFEFAVPLVRPTTLGMWDRLGLWTIVAIVLVAVAYGYPLMQLLAHPRFGSPPFKPF